MVFDIEEVRINGRSRKETESEYVLSTSMLNLVLVLEALRPVAEMTVDIYIEGYVAGRHFAEGDVLWLL